MKEYLRKLPKEIQDLISLASDIAAKNNVPAYLVGGFVRDLILGVKNLDLDIVVEGDGIKFAEALADISKAKLIRHKRFGTAAILLRHNLKIDVATARSEVYPYPASLPVVTPGSLRDDLARRDFTINAMAISITQVNFGRLIDMFGGKDDLRRKKVRILHDFSFVDDPTRILRAIRFAARYGFTLEIKTLKLLKQAARAKMLQQVQPQRLRDEIILALREERSLNQIRQLQKLAGFSFISRHLSVSASRWKLLRRTDCQIKWFLKAYPKRRQLDLWLIYFMALIDSLSLNAAKMVCKEFAFRKGEEKRILSYKKIIRTLIPRLSESDIKPSRIFSLLQPQSYEVIILIKAKYKNANTQKHIKDFFEIYNGMRLYISGHDLHRLGVKPGPKYQQILTSVLNAKLNGCVRTEEEELSLIRRLIPLRRRPRIKIC